MGVNEWNFEAMGQFPVRTATYWALTRWTWHWEWIVGV
jgi:hypothetical protein